MTWQVRWRIKKPVKQELRGRYGRKQNSLGVISEPYYQQRNLEIGTVGSNINSAIPYQHSLPTGTDTETQRTNCWLSTERRVGGGQNR